MVPSSTHHLLVCSCLIINALSTPILTFSTTEPRSYRGTPTADESQQPHNLFARAAASSIPSSAVPYINAQGNIGSLAVTVPIVRPDPRIRKLADRFSIYFSAIAPQSKLAYSDASAAIQYLTDDVGKINFTFPASDSYRDGYFSDNKQAGAAVELTIDGRTVSSYKAPANQTSGPPPIKLQGGAGSESKIIAQGLQEGGIYQIPMSDKIGTPGYVGYLNKIISNAIGSLTPLYTSDSQGTIQGVSFVIVKEGYPGYAVANGTVNDVGYLASIFGN